MNSADPLHVFMVAPAILCWGFEKLFHAASTRIRITGTADTLAEAATRSAGLPVDVIMIDLDDGYDQDAIAQAAGIAPVLVLTSARSSPRLEDEPALRNRVSAVVRKTDPPLTILRAVEDAVRKTPPRRGGHFPSDFEQIRIASLTTRERQLIFAVLCNATAPGKVIASRLCISEHTLRNHLSSIYSKLGVQGRLSLHAFATQHHLDSDPGFGAR